MKKIILLLISQVYIANGVFAQNTITLQPGPEQGKDATIDSMYPDMNRGDQTDFDAVCWTNSGFPVTFRSLIEFDLSSIQDSTILNATLFLYNDPLSLNNYGEHSSLTGSNIAWLRRITEEWQEATVTWGMQPGTTTLNQVIVPQSASPHQDYVIDVTALVQDMTDNPASSHGFMLLEQTEVPYRCLIFASSDNLNPVRYPKLSVTYSSCPAPEAGFQAVLENQQARFTDTSRQATAWYWSFGDSTFSMERNPVHYYQAPGTYKTCLIASSNCGSDTACSLITAGNPGEGEGFNLYPNPTDGIIFFTLPFPNSNAFSLEILNPLGQVIRKFQITPSPGETLQQIDLSSFNSGVIMIRFSQKDTSFSEKVLKINNR